MPAWRPNPTLYARAVMGALDLVSGWPGATASCGALVRRDGRVHVHATTGPLDRTFEWASVTKLCTALAVLVAVEEGTLSLQEPAGPPGATVAHLLAHASGLGPDGGVMAEVGRRRIYSNAGYHLLAATLAERSDMAFAAYLTEAVFVPLGMRDARLDASGSAAFGVQGSLADLLALGTELLAPSIVAADTLGSATSLAFPGLDGVLPGFGFQVPCDWGLGFELKDAKAPHWTGRRCSPATFGHFGRSGSFLWVDPVAGVACAGLSGTQFGPWAAAAWPALADAVLDEVTGAEGRRQRPA